MLYFKSSAYQNWELQWVAFSFQTNHFALKLETSHRSESIYSKAFNDSHLSLQWLNFYCATFDLYILFRREFPRRLILSFGYRRKTLMKCKLYIFLYIIYNFNVWCEKSLMNTKGVSKIMVFSLCDISKYWKRDFEIL